MWEKRDSGFQKLGRDQKQICVLRAYRRELSLAFCFERLSGAPTRPSCTPDVQKLWHNGSVLLKSLLVVSCYISLENSHRLCQEYSVP